MDQAVCWPSHCLIASAVALLLVGPGVPIPQPLPDRRQGGVLPQQLPAQEVLRSEGATFSCLHSYIQSIYLWATCAEQGNNVKWQVPEGWTLNK